MLFFITLGNTFFNTQWASLIRPRTGVEVGINITSVRKICTQYTCVDYVYRRYLISPYIAQLCNYCRIACLQGIGSKIFWIKSKHTKLEIRYYNWCIKFANIFPHSIIGSYSNTTMYLYTHILTASVDDMMIITITVCNHDEQILI